TGSVNGCCFRRQIGELNTLLAPAPTERAEFTLCGPANSLVRLDRTCICLQILSQVTSYLTFPRTCDPDLSIPIFEPYAISWAAALLSGSAPFFPALPSRMESGQPVHSGEPSRTA